jgi:hypothetical protein
MGFQQKGNMKKLYISAMAVLAGFLLLTACSDDRNTNLAGGGNNSGGDNGSTNFAPASVQNRTLNATVINGSSPFANTGSFSAQFNGATTGTFNTTGTGGPVTSTGTFNYNPVTSSQANLLLQDSQLGTVVMTLNFQSKNVGTFTSSSTTGGTQNGTFTLL